MGLLDPWTSEDIAEFRESVGHLEEEYGESSVLPVALILFVINAVLILAFIAFTAIEILPLLILLGFLALCVGALWLLERATGIA